MNFKKLDALLNNSMCFFHCKEIDNPSNVTDIYVQHRIGPNLDDETIEFLDSEYGHIDGLVEFYSCYGSIDLFHHIASGEIAFRISPPEHWDNLKSDFQMWTKGINQNDGEDLLPEWLDNYCVVAERPGTGNYFLMPYKGEFSGCVYEFDHDGFSFTQVSIDFPSFVNSVGTLDEDKLEEISTNLRFINPDNPSVQWKISTYYDGSNTIFLDRKGSGYALNISCTVNRLTSKEKTTSLAKLEFPELDSFGYSGIEHTEIRLPGKDAIVISCEISKNGNSLSVSERVKESIYSGKPLLDIYSNEVFTAFLSFSENISLRFELTS